MTRSQFHASDEGGEEGVSAGIETEGGPAEIETEGCSDKIDTWNQIGDSAEMDTRKGGWYSIAGQPAPAPNRISYSCEHIPDGFDLHLLQKHATSSGLC